MSTANALQRIDDLVKNIEDLRVILTEFLNEEPDGDELIAMRVLYGNRPFDNGIEDPDVIRHMTEAGQLQSIMALNFNPLWP